MNVLHIYKDYIHNSKGGVEQAIYQLCRETTLRGVKNKVLTLGDKHSGYEEIERDEARVISCPCTAEISSCKFSWSIWKRYKRYAEWADVVHYHFPWPLEDLLHLLSRINKPSLVTYHSDIIKQKVLNLFYSPLKHAFLSSVDHIVATSPNYVQTSSVLSGFKSKVSVIPLGLNPESYPDVEPRILSGWKTKLGGNFFLFIGVLRYYKGLNILLDAAAMSKEHFVLAGAGPLEKELRSKASSLGLNNVHFLGRIREKDKAALLSLCRGVILPSHLRSEAFGLTLLEGAMFERPLISAEIGTGTSFINEHGVTGIVVPASDPEALKNAAEKLGSSPDLAERMGKNAGKRFFKLFTAQKQAGQYIKLYESLIRAKTRPGNATG